MKACYVQPVVFETNFGVRKIIVTSMQECYINCVCLSPVAKSGTQDSSLLKEDAQIENNWPQWHVIKISQQESVLLWDL